MQCRIRAQKVKGDCAGRVDETALAGGLPKVRKHPIPELESGSKADATQPTSMAPQAEVIDTEANLTTRLMTAHDRTRFV